MLGCLEPRVELYALKTRKKPVPLPGMNFRYVGLLVNTGIELIYSGSVDLQIGIRKLWDTLKVLGEEGLE
jgi:hypothetical protein